MDLTGTTVFLLFVCFSPDVQLFFPPLCPSLQLSVFGAVGRPTRRVSGDSGSRYGLSKAEFMEKVQQSNEACQRGDFQAAAHLYSEALQADPQNCILYSNRSAALLKLGQHQAALDDAEKARELNPKWPKVGKSPRLKYGRTFITSVTTLDRCDEENHTNGGALIRCLNIVGGQRGGNSPETLQKHSLRSEIVNCFQNTQDCCRRLVLWAQHRWSQ